uniref:Vacuolar ATPase assembly integral membrane protein VMA21 homolog n=1 Tax=Plectus sambesii TaxID=2011161 RepID=A0A914WSJ1_9BILA
MEELIPNFRDRETQTAVKRLVIYSLVIIVVPLLSMFLLKLFLFEGIFGYSSQDSILYAAIIAVVIVHIVLGFFVYAAWKEEITPRTAAEEKEEKID